MTIRDVISSQTHSESEIVFRLSGVDGSCVYSEWEGLMLLKSNKPESPAMVTKMLKY